MHIVKKTLVAAVLCGMAAVSLAQEAGSQASGTSAEEADVSYIPYGNLSGATAEDLAKAKELGASIAQELLQAYEQKKTPEMEAAVMQQKRRADDIADAGLSGERKKVLEFLGIDPDADTALYYFVSWSMPIEMLRSYAIEAMWSGGTLVFKGVPPGKDLAHFLLEDLKSLVYGKGASANISIDPRLFDAYEVATVPTIVFTTVRANMQCQGVNPVKFSYEDKELSYDTCPSLNPASYSKVNGSVTSSYALQTFVDDGFSGVQPYMRALSRGFSEGKVPEKAQANFTGRWDDVLSPEAQEAARSAAKAVLTPAAS